MNLNRFNLSSLIDARLLSGIILWMHPANERRHYIVTSTILGWANSQNDPFIIITSPDSLSIEPLRTFSCSSMKFLSKYISSTIYDEEIHRKYCLQNVKCKRKKPKHVLPEPNWNVPGGTTSQYLGCSYPDCLYRQLIISQVSNAVEK